VKYSAFSIHLDWACAGLNFDSLLLAQALVEQTEVRDFIARNVEPDCLLSTTAFASHLPHYLGYQILEGRNKVMQLLYENREDVFLEFWEEFVYPILRDPENEHWAEKWRGGHITNYAG
jgi:hypothetical protein